MRPLLFLLLAAVWGVASGSNVITKAKEEAQSDDASKLLEVARSWYREDKTRDDALHLLHHLADSQKHVLATAKLGHHYVADGNQQKAISYYMKAGEEGPHHQSLYNAGKLLIEQKEWVGGLAYLRAAATLSDSYSAEYISKETTQAAMLAYDIVCQRLAREELLITETADVFVFGSLTELPDDMTKLWTEAVVGLVSFNKTFVQTNGKIKNRDNLQSVTQSLRSLWEKSGLNGSLSPLQSFLLLDKINDMLGILVAYDDKYIPMAAGYAEALAFHSVYCYDHIAVDEADSSCFNRAAANAMAYYRRTGDVDSTKRLLKACQKHPEAATHWKYMDQTPRVFRPFVKSKKQWNAADFSATVALQSAFQARASTIHQELQAIQKLPEGTLRGANPAATEVDIQPDGTIIHSTLDKNIGIHRLFSPSIGVRTTDVKTAETGAGAWAEFGPLFDGQAWNAEKCAIVPTICDALRSNPSLCTVRSGIGSSESVWRHCGTEAVVTIRRLRPGTTILPHCGTTNARLTMHFSLQGAAGVEVTVGGTSVLDYGGGDGHALVFDDSYETSVDHGGDSDSFVVVAVLKHPGVR